MLDVCLQHRCSLVASLVACYNVTCPHWCLQDLTCLSVFAYTFLKKEPPLKPLKLNLFEPGSCSMSRKPSLPLSRKPENPKTGISQVGLSCIRLGSGLFRLRAFLFGLELFLTGVSLRSGAPAYVALGRPKSGGKWWPTAGSHTANPCGACPPPTPPISHAKQPEWFGRSRGLNTNSIARN